MAGYIWFLVAMHCEFHVIHVRFWLSVGVWYSLRVVEVGKVTPSSQCGLKLVQATSGLSVAERRSFLVAEDMFLTGV